MLKVREEASVFVVVFMKHTIFLSVKKLNSHFNDLLFVWIVLLLPLFGVTVLL